MNVQKLQIALNHSDEAIINQGLVRFTEQVLQEHNALETYGYLGRSMKNYSVVEESTDLPHNHHNHLQTITTTGLLYDYINSARSHNLSSLK